MYAAPPLKTEVFARIPEKYWISGRSTRWIDVMRRAPTDCFLEGPSFDREGNLYVVDVASGRIFRISPDARVELIAEYEGEPNGLKIHRDGRIFIADYRHGIMLLDVATGRVTPDIDRGTIERFKGVNDLVFAGNGDLYFTDQGLTGLQDPTGRLYRLRATGQVDMVVDCIPSPNGLVLSLDENTVFVNVTRANAVWRVPLWHDGTAFKVGEFIRMSGVGGPDGLAMAKNGNLAVAHLGMWDRLAVQRPRRAADANSFMHRLVDNKRRVRGARRKIHLHHGIRNRSDPDGSAGGTRPADVLARCTNSPSPPY